MVIAVVLDIPLGGTVNMLKKMLRNILDFGIIFVIVVALTSCASGGGSGGLATSQAPTYQQVAQSQALNTAVVKILNIIYIKIITTVTAVQRLR